MYPTPVIAVVCGNEADRQPLLEAFAALGQQERVRCFAHVEDLHAGLEGTPAAPLPGLVVLPLTARQSALLAALKSSQCTGDLPVLVYIENGGCNGQEEELHAQGAYACVRRPLAMGSWIKQAEAFLQLCDFFHERRLRQRGSYFL